MNDFENEQREFIKFCLRAGASNIQIANDFAEMRGVPQEDQKERQKIYRRTQRIKEKMPTDEIGAVELEGPLSDTPQWRKMYLRFALVRTTDPKVQAQILRDMDKIDQRLGKQKRKSEKAAQNTHKTETSASVLNQLVHRDAELWRDEQTLVCNAWELSIYDANLIPDDILKLPHFDHRFWHGHVLSGGPWPNDCLHQTFLPRAEYEYIFKEGTPERLPYRDTLGDTHRIGYRRKKDGVQVRQNGLPINTPVEKRDPQQREGETEYPEMDPARAIYLENFRKKNPFERYLKMIEND